MLGGDADAGRMLAWVIEVGGAARRAGGFADGPAGEVTVRRIGGRFADPFALLLLGAIPGHGHEPEAVDQQDSGEARIDRGDLLGDDLQVDIADAAATTPVGCSPG